MDYKYIEQLIDRYFDGETSLQEEQILRSFFSQNEVPAELAPYKDLFRYEQVAAKEGLGDDFDVRMMEILEQQPVVKARRVSLTARLKPFFRAAAVVAVILTVGNAAQHSFTAPATEDYNYDGYTDTYTDPTAAYQQVSSALEMVSEGISKGQEQKLDSVPEKKVE